MIKVICVLKTGGDYDYEDVLSLKCQIETHVNYPYEFACYSDDERVATDKLTMDLEGWWSKIEIFENTGPCIFLDLDTVLCGDISILAKYIDESYGEFLMLEHFDKSKILEGKAASGVMAWNGDFSFLRSDFKEKNKKCRMDQVYIVNKLRRHGIKIGFVNEIIGSIVSYRWHSRTSGIPSNAVICCFHGKPRPRTIGMPFWGFHLTHN